jgi:ABC-2 type transport system permease protein
VKAFRDIWLVFQRNMLLVLRSPLWVFLGVAQPVVYLALFAPLLKPALTSTSSLDVNSMADAYRIYVPGMLVALALGGGLYVGFGLLGDLAAGVIERSRVTPISRVSMLIGRGLRDMVSMLVQAAILTILSAIFGMFVNIGSILLGFLILALVNLTATSVSYGVALKVSGPNVLGQVINNVAQPLMLLSGTLLPVALAPLWLRDIANFNPFNWAVTGMRALFIGHTSDPHIWQSLIIMAVLSVLAIAWSSRLFAKSVR